MTTWDRVVAERADHPVEREPGGAWILTSRLSAVVGLPFLEGTRITTCDVCGELAVVGPSSLHLRVGRVFCSVCKPANATVVITEEALDNVDKITRLVEGN